MSFNENVIRWIVGSILILASIFFCVLNGLAFWKIYIRKSNASWIFLVGGVLGMFGFLIVPFDLAHKWCWVPLLLDWGSIPGFLDVIIFYTWYFFKSSRNFKTKSEHKKSQTP